MTGTLPELNQLKNVSKKYPKVACKWYIVPLFSFRFSSVPKYARVQSSLLQIFSLPRFHLSPQIYHSGNESLCFLLSSNMNEDLSLQMVAKVANYGIASRVLTCAVPTIVGQSSGRPANNLLLNQSTAVVQTPCKGFQV